MESPFLHLPSEHRAIAELVFRAASEECPPESCLVAPFLEKCVSDSVEAFLDVPVTSHVQIFALRHVRCCIRAGTCDCGPC
jgi:hypothetical protein